MRRFALGFSVLLMMMLVVVSSTAFASGKTNLMLIFDASGSMWGQIDGKAKIVIAKEAMDLIVKDLPKDIHLGLVAYGHRRKGDCDDVETLIPLGPLNTKSLLAKINALSPKGKTPMVRSIRMTADAIKHLEDETSILLVSDGKETCDPEPCNFVAELKKLGIKFRLHVVGFDVGGETEEQLKCMAKAGGGEYFPAKDAGKLKDALNTVIEKTVVKNLKVSVFLNGEPIGASVTVQDPETGQIVTKSFSSEKQPLMLSVKPGTYTVTVADEWVQADRPKQVVENVQITDKELREIKVNFGGGTLVVWTLRNGKPFKGRVKVSTMDGKSVGKGFETTYPDKPATFVLQPGRYQLAAEDSWGTKAKIDAGVFEIGSGQTIEKKAAFDSGKIVAWVYKNGKPAHARILLVDANGERGWETTYEDRPATFTKMPGTYTITAEDSWGSRVRKDGGAVTIAGGQVIEKKISIDTGKITLWTHRGGKPFHARVKITDMNDETVQGGWGTTHEDQPATYTLMPGMYKVIAEDSWGKPVVRLKFGVVEIKAGQTLNKICDFDAPPSQNEVQLAPKATPQTAAVNPPKQTNRETADTAAPSAQKPQDIQATAARMQANAQAQAAAAQANAMAQMQAALTQMQAPQTSQPAQAQETQDAGARQEDVNENPKDIALPQVPDEPSESSAKIVTPDDNGAQPMGRVGATPSTVDYSNVGARDTGGGLDDNDERPEQGRNPYEGMTKEQMQAAFARDMGTQGPENTFRASDWRLGNDYQMDAKRYLKKMQRETERLGAQAANANNADASARVEKAKRNLLSLQKALRDDASKETLQRMVYTRAQEVNAIRISLAQGQ